jgi:hypothetical protein
MNTIRRVLVGIAASFALASGPALSQPGAPPIDATIFFTNLPAASGAIPYFDLSNAIPVTVQVKVNTSADVATTRGFSQTDFYRLLYLVRNNTTGSAGQILTASGQPLHRHDRVGQCLSRSGTALDRATPVVPVEILKGTGSGGQPFFVQFDIPDIRQYYELKEQGRYSIRARIPFSWYQGTPILDCDSFFVGTAPIPVVDVGPNGQHLDFTVQSNAIEFITCCNRFVGFGQPLGPENTVCNTKQPYGCDTVNQGNAEPTKFQLFDPAGNPVRDAVARISVRNISPGGLSPTSTDLGKGSLPTNTFRYDSGGNQYVFNLDTGVLPKGTWEIGAQIEGEKAPHVVQFVVR